MLTSHGTQTDDDLPSPRGKIETRRRSSPKRIDSEQILVSTPEEVEESELTKTNLGPYHNEEGENTSPNNSYSGTTVIAESPVEILDKEKHDSVVDNEHESEAEDEYEEPVIYEAAKAQTAKANKATLSPQVVNVVSIGKRIPPALPPRSPRRKIDQASGRSSEEELSSGGEDKRMSAASGSVSGGEFDEVSLNGERGIVMKDSTTHETMSPTTTKMMNGNAYSNSKTSIVEEEKTKRFSAGIDENAMPAVPGGW